MAGKPQRKIRDLRAALSSAGIDPDALQTAAPSTTTTTAPRPTPGIEDLPRVGAHARTHAHPRPTGPVTRAAVDQRTASDLANLASQLAPGFVVRLERTRPTWAAGWVEDLPIDDQDLGAVLEYVRDEHGGQLYRASVLSSDGAELYSARIPIAGPPRRRGRPISRAAWDGADDERQHNTAPAPSSSPQGLQMADVVALMQVMQQSKGTNQDAVLEAVREMTSQTQRSTSELLRAVLQQRSEERKTNGLQHQLREVVEASQAIEEIREALAVHADAPPQAGRDDSDPMQEALKQAAVSVLAQGMQNEMRRGPPAPGQPPPGYRRVQPRPTPQQRAPMAQPAKTRPAPAQAHPNGAPKA